MCSTVFARQCMDSVEVKIKNKSLKPIFHCNAKYLASGVGVGQCPRRHMLVYFGVSPDANPRCQSVEYRWRWVFWHRPCIFHVYFMYISCIVQVVCASFYALATRTLADAKAVFSGIWA